MKKLLLTLIIVLISIVAYSQTEYPVIKIDENGERVVIMSIRQANILASKAELLWLYENYFEGKQDVDKLTLEIIDSQNRIIYDQDVSISLLKENILTKDEKIKILMQQLELIEQMPSTEIITVKDEVAEKKLKRQRIISGGLGILVIILLIL